MGVLVEEVVLHLPGVVEAEPIGQRHLVQRLMEQRVLVALVPGPRQLQLVENSEAHFIPFAAIVIRRWARCRGRGRAGEAANADAADLSSASLTTPGRSKNRTRKDLTWGRSTARSHW